MAYLAPTNKPIVCTLWEINQDGLGVCKAFELYDVPETTNPFFSQMAELSQLTYAQSSELLSLTALIFAMAWLFKRLSLETLRG